MHLQPDLMDLWLPAYCAIVLLHLISAPWTKVEESFNIQAVHDLIVHGSKTELYDHNSFPGVVPRSFVGAAVLAILTRVLAIALPALSQDWAQHAARATLGALCCSSTAMLRSAVTRQTGSPLAGNMFLVLSSAQFHVPFYATRTLPNTFAMALSCAAWACWLDGKRPRSTIRLLTVATGWNVPRDAHQAQRSFRSKSIGTAARYPAQGRELHFLFWIRELVCFG